MKKIVLFLLAGFPFCAKASHVMGGEITYEWLGGYSYELRAVMYIDNSVNTPDSVIQLCYGDGQCDTVALTATVVNNGITQCEYILVHTYPGPGTYEIGFQRPNWLSGVINIVNSTNVIFAASAELIISPFFANGNSSTVLQTYHWDVGYAPGAIMHYMFPDNPDNDSLVYSFVPCAGMAVPLVYNYPDAFGGSSYMDQAGSYYFYNLSSQGYYAVNVKIEEWNSGVLRGVVYRQMVFNYIISSVEEISRPGLTVQNYGDSWVVSAGEIIRSLKVYDINGKLVFVGNKNDKTSMKIPAFPGCVLLQAVTPSGKPVAIKYIGL